MDTHYIETDLVRRGFHRELSLLPIRDIDQSADSWQIECDAMVTDLLDDGQIDRLLADRLIAAAEILADELRERPKMVRWCHRQYCAAVTGSIAYHDDKARWLAASIYRFPGETEESAFIDSFLFGLIS